MHQFTVFLIPRLYLLQHFWKLILILYNSARTHGSSILQILLKKALAEEKLEEVKLFLLHSILLPHRGLGCDTKSNKVNRRFCVCFFPAPISLNLESALPPPPPTKYHSENKIIFTNIIFYLKKLCSFFCVER